MTIALALRVLRCTLPHAFAALVPLLAGGVIAQVATIEVAPQVGHSSGAPRAIALSHNGLWLVSGDVVRRLIFWDVAAGRIIRAQTTSGTGISALAFSPDDSLVAVGDYDGNVRILDTASGAETALLKGRQEVKAVGWRGARTLLVHHATHLAEWSTSSWTAEGESRLSLAANVVHRGSFSADGRYLLAVYRAGRQDNHRSFVVDTRTGRVVLEAAGGIAALSVEGGRPTLYILERDRLLRRTSANANAEVILSAPDLAEPYRVSGPMVTPDGRFVLIDSGGSLNLVDTRTKVASRIARTSLDVPTEPMAMSATHAAFISTGQSIRALKLPQGGAEATLITFSSYDSPAVGAAFASGEASLAIVHRSPFGNFAAEDQKGRFSVLDSANWTMRDIVRLPPGPADDLAALRLPGTDAIMGFGSGDTHFLLQRSGTAGPVLLPSASPRSSSQRGVFADPSCPAAISADARTGAVARLSRTLSLWDLAAGKAMAQIGHYESLKTTFDFGMPACLIQGLALSPDGRFLAVSNASNTRLDVWRTQDASFAEGIEAPAEDQMAFPHLITFRALAFSPTGDLLAASSDTRTRIFTFPGLKPLHDLGEGSGSRKVAFSPDGKRLINTQHDGSIRVWTVGIRDGPTVLMGHSDAITDLVMSPDSRRLVSTSRDGTARIWDLPGARPLAQYLAFPDGEWVLVTPEGYFAGSQGGPTWLNFRRGMTLYSLNQFYDVFHRPDIVQAKLRGEDISQLVSLTVDEALRAPPPTVKLERLAESASGRVRVKYSVLSAGGGVGNIRLYLNGKLVHLDGAAPIDEATEQVALESVTPDAVRALQRGAVVAARRPDTRRLAPRPDQVEGEIEIDTVNGENEVGAVAFNRDNSVQSGMSALRLTVQRAEEPPRLHVLAIGINRYRDAKSELKRAVDDARAFGTRVAAAGHAYYPADRIELVTLYDDQATRERIVAALDQVAAKTRPQDMMVIFMAAHGVLHGGRYALVTHDYAGRVTPDTVISAEYLVALSQRARSLHQLFVLDTCHAGGLNNELRAFYDSRVSLFARNSGIHVFAGASDRQGALDDHEGNGLFTHVLLRGMAARDADRNADGQVTITELGAFSNTEARRIARQKNVVQTPVFLHFGRDRPVTRLTAP